MAERLVRDGIAEILNAEGVSYRIADLEEMPNLVRAKVAEEVAEFLEAPSAEEAADVIEALVIAAWHLARATETAVFDERLRKLRQRGGFEAGVVLIEKDK